MTSFLTLLRRGMVLAAWGVAGLAIAALFGFAIRELDALNHLQMLLFPGTLVAVLVMIVLARGRLRSFGIIAALVGAVASANAVLPEIVSAMQPRPAAHGPVLKMLTHNVFGLNDDIADVRALIAEEDPDIVVLQEYFRRPAATLHPLLIEAYPYFARCRGGKRANLALYSRLPFQQIDDGGCPQDSYGVIRSGHILARFNGQDGEDFSVLTTHIDWPLPARRQQEQMQVIVNAAKAVDGPLIIAGDFNSTPWSYALRGFERDSGLMRQTRNLLTYPMRWFYLDAWRQTIPFLALDQVFTRGVTVSDLHGTRPTASDHLPVVFTFSVP